MTELDNMFHVDRPSKWSLWDFVPFLGYELALDRHWDRKYYDRDLEGRGDISRSTEGEARIEEKKYRSKLRAYNALAFVTGAVTFLSAGLYIVSQR